MSTFNRGGGLNVISTSLAALTLVAGTIAVTVPAQARDRSNASTDDRPDVYVQRDNDHARRNVGRALAYGLGGVGAGLAAGSVYGAYGAPRYGERYGSPEYGYHYGHPGYGYGRPAYDDGYGG